MLTRGLLLATLLVSGCAGDARPRILTAANAIEPTLVAVYEAQGDACVNSNSVRAAAVSCVAAVDSRWAPVWTALAAVATANDALAAWCAFSTALAPLGAAALPVVDGVVCP